MVVVVGDFGNLLVVQLVNSQHADPGHYAVLVHCWEMTGLDVIFQQRIEIV